MQAIVFDVFGTLAEIGQRRRPYLRLMKLAAAAGRKPKPDDAAKIMGTDCDILGIADSLGLSLTAEMRAVIDADLAAEIASISLFSDAVPVLEHLRNQGIKIAVCSNLAKPYAAPVLALLPFELDAYAWSFEVGAVKPDPAIFSAVCKKLDLPPAEILFVGDSYAADCAGPRAFGMQALHLARDGKSPDAEFAVSLLDLKQRGRARYPEPAKAVGFLPAYACACCGAKHGSGTTPDANAWQHGVCGICGIETLVSEFLNSCGHCRQGS